MRRCVVFENVTVIRPANRKTVFTPAMGSQVTVMTSEEKRLFRKLAKVQKKSKSDDEVRDLQVNQLLLFRQTNSFVLERTT